MKKCIVVLMLWSMLMLAGCGSDLATGILIGAGGSVGLTEAQTLAQESKLVLANEIIELREQLANTTDSEEVARLEEKLETAEKKQNTAEIADLVTTTVATAIRQDWQKPTEPDESGQAGTSPVERAAAALFLLYGLWQKRKNLVVTKGIAKNSAEATPEAAGKLYADIKKYNTKLIP